MNLRTGTSLRALAYTPSPRACYTTGTTLQLQHGALPNPEDTIWTEEVIGACQDIFEGFRKDWEVRWDKHREQYADRWTPFTTCCSRTLPRARQEMPTQPITLATWRKAVQRKKKTSATGLDQVSGQDLLQLPDNLT